MSTYHNLYTVGTTAVAISQPQSGSGRDITLQNINGAGYIYIGGEGVTEANYGYRLSPNHSISFELERQDDLYAIGSDTELKLAVLSVNLEGKD
jgi:hypothetical protein